VSRPLTDHLLLALTREFPFLDSWQPELHKADRPVTFQVAGRLDPAITWRLEYGRYNDAIDPSYTNGVTHVGLSDGQTIDWVELAEGETTPEMVLTDSTRFVLTCFEYRSELIYADPGRLEFTLYKRVPETVEAIQRDVNQAARAMREQLERPIQPAVRLDFLDGAGAPLRSRTWTPRDGVVMVPRGADQLRILLGDSREGDAHAQLEAPEASSRYVIREATLIIDQTLTEPQLRDLEARLGTDQEPRQFRSDAGEFQFPLEIPASGDPLDHPAVVYARVHELAHRVETYATL
jgi:hypothetical protein